jgi:hypothetical protein
LDETPRSFVNAMEGASEASFERYELATFAAYQAARMSAAAQAGKLGSLSKWMPKKPDKGRSGAAKAVAFFHRMKAAGLGVKIERVPSYE